MPEWQTENEWHPLFVEALQRERHIEYLTDVLLYSTAEDLNAIPIGSDCINSIENTQQKFQTHMAYLCGELGL